MAEVYCTVNILIFLLVKIITGHFWRISYLEFHLKIVNNAKKTKQKRVCFCVESNNLMGRMEDFQTGLCWKEPVENI